MELHGKFLNCSASNGQIQTSCTTYRILRPSPNNPEILLFIKCLSQVFFLFQTEYFYCRFRNFKTPNLYDFICYSENAYFAFFLLVIINSRTFYWWNCTPLYEPWIHVLALKVLRVTIDDQVAFTKH